MADQPKRKINYDRGVTFMLHQPTGMNVFMYKNEPGVYRNIFEGIVPEEMAKEAGFDVEKFAKERNRRERMAAAMDAIDAELKEADSVEQKVVVENQGYRVIEYGAGRHNVKDPDGNVLNTVPLSLEVATRLVERLVPQTSAE